MVEKKGRDENGGRRFKYRPLLARKNKNDFFYQLNLKG